MKARKVMVYGVVYVNYMIMDHKKWISFLSKLKNHSCLPFLVCEGVP